MTDNVNGCRTEIPKTNNSLNVRKIDIKIDKCMYYIRYMVHDMRLIVASLRATTYCITAATAAAKVSILTTFLGGGTVREGSKRFLSIGIFMRQHKNRR